MSEGIVVITGGGRGIGRATAVQFARHGWYSIVSYQRNNPEAETAVKECQAAGGGAEALQVDVTDNQSIGAFAAAASERHGRIDVLVANAGVIKWEPFSKQSFEDIEQQLRTNVEGVIKLVHALAPLVRRSIVLIGSDIGKKPHSGLPIYCASKAAVIMFARALAEAHNGVAVRCVNPDRTATAMNDFGGRSPDDVAEVIYEAACAPQCDQRVEWDV